jgi:hypothetical protein
MAMVHISYVTLVSDSELVSELPCGVDHRNLIFYGVDEMGEIRRINDVVITEHLITIVVEILSFEFLLAEWWLAFNLPLAQHILCLVATKRSKFLLWFTVIVLAG